MKRTMVHRLLALAAAGIVLPTAYATSCLAPPPCGYVHPQSILFAGTVKNVREIEAPRRGPETISIFAATVSLGDVFVGLPQISGEENAEHPGEATVFYEGPWLLPGVAYLFDVSHGSDGQLWPSICGATNELRSEHAVEIVGYLKRLRNGDEDTSLEVAVFHQHQAIAEVRLQLEGPGRVYSAISDRDGRTRFEDLSPGSYKLVAALGEGYRLVPKTTDTMEVALGSCERISAELAAETSLSGLVLDAFGNPVATLPLQMQSLPKNPGERFESLQSARSITDADGRFRFESLVPGRYYLGTNLHARTAPVPRVYYPGRDRQDVALPIDVKLGQAIDNLVLTLPDIGPPREISLAVVAADGHPAAGVRIFTGNDGLGPEYGGLYSQDARGPQTGPAGELIVSTYEKVPFKVQAVRMGYPNPLLGMERSQEIEIPPGEGPVRVVLQLKPPPVRRQTSTTK